MKKRTLILFMLLGFCVALPGCGDAGKQHKSQNEYNQNSSKDDSEDDSKDDSEDDSKDDSEDDAESSSEDDAESSSEDDAESSAKGDSDSSAKGDSVSSAKGNTVSNSKGDSDSSTKGDSVSSSESNSVSNSVSSSDSSSGSSSDSSDNGSVTTPAQESKVIKSIAAIKNITVDYGTDEADAKKRLPGKVELKTNDGETISANVTWKRKGGETYNEKPTSATAVAYVGTVTIPNGYTYTGKLTVTAKITVRGGNKTIKGLSAPIKDVTVDYNTSEADAKKQLPGKVKLKTYAGKTVSANVTWKRKSGKTYNATPDKDKAVVYVGTVTIPKGYTYTDKLTVTAKITVRGSSKTIKELSASVSDFAVDYNISEADAMAKLPDKISLKTYDGKTVSAKVTWKRKSGETYTAAMDSDTVIVYVGTVTIPKGYTYTGELTVTAKITVRSGNKTIQGLSSPINDFTVDYNTSEADAKKQLPGKVELKTYDGKTISANVTWARGSGETYNEKPTSAAAVAYVGTVTIPKGYTYTGKLTVTAKITVRGGDKTVKRLSTSVSGIEVAYNTSEADAMAKLPGKVELENYNGKTVSAKVTWERKSGETYNATPTSAATVAYVGTVQIPDGYAYAGTLTAETTITVRGGDRTIEKLIGPSGGFEVVYGTSEADAIKRLPGEVRLLSYTDASVYVPVTWERKSSETYHATPASDTPVTYVAHVQIPDGYYYAGETTMETTITVLENGKPETKKKVTFDAVMDAIYIESYISDQNKIKENCPDKIRLLCEDDSPITATVDKGKWRFQNLMAPEPGSNYGSYLCSYSLDDITLPDGYEFSGSTAGIDAMLTIYVKQRDDSKLEEAINAAEALNLKITASELVALTNSDSIYKAPDGAKPSEVSAGVKFIEKSRIEPKLTELQDLRYDARHILWVDTSQAEVDTMTEQLNAKVAEVKTFLDSSCQTGTGYTTVMIARNVSEKLKSFEGNSNYAYDPVNYPMILGKSYTLPQYVSVVIDAEGNTADVELEWTVDGGDVTFTFKDTDDNGVKLKNAVLTPTATYKDEPKTLSCQVYAVGYRKGSTWVSLDEWVETYNNCLTGAPIRKEASKVNVDHDIPKLISGKESSQRFNVWIPFPYSDEHVIKIKDNPDRIKAEDVSGYAEGTLLDELKVFMTDCEALTYPGFWLTAKVAQLPAVIDPTETNPYVNGKVKLSVPADIITLTDYAKKQGWYIPEDKWEVEADVWVYNPVVKVQKAELNGNEVNVSFSTTHWGDSRGIQMALVPSTEATFDGTATGCFVSSAVAVAADGAYTADISASGITAGKYAVWVKVGNEQWQKSQCVYQ